MIRHVLAAIAATLSISAAADDAQLARGAADVAYFEAMSGLGANADPETRRLIAVALAISYAKGGALAALPAQPQAITVQAPAARPWIVDVLTGGLQFMKETLTGLGPIAAQVVIARRQSQTQERLGEFARDQQIATVNGFRDLGTAGVNGVRDTAGLGFAAIPAVLTVARPGNVVTVSGNGNSVGSGPVTYNPLTNSYNPNITQTTNVPQQGCVAQPPLTTCP